MRPSDKWRKPHVHRPSSSWRTPTIAGRIIQQGASNLGSFQSILDDVSGTSSQGANRERWFPGPDTDKEELDWDISQSQPWLLTCETVEFRTLRGGSRATSSPGFLDSRLQPKKAAWKNAIGHGSGETMSPGKLSHMQGSPPPSSRRNHSEKKENEQRAAAVFASDSTSKISLWESWG